MIRNIGVSFLTKVSMPVIKMVQKMRGIPMKYRQALVSSSTFVGVSLLIPDRVREAIRVTQGRLRLMPKEKMVKIVLSRCGGLHSST